MSAKTSDTILGSLQYLSSNDADLRALSNIRIVPDVDPHLFPSIYHEPWWLEICGAKQISTVTVEHNAIVQARLSFQTIRSNGLNRIGLPQMVHFGGPSFAADAGSAMHKMNIQQELTQGLLDQLPVTDEVSFKLHAGITDTLAFQRAGFSTAVQFTFEIYPAPAATLLAGIRRGHRRMIRSASDRYTVAPASDPAEFIETYARNIAASGKRFHFDHDRLSTLMNETLLRNRGSVLLARDTDGRTVAGLFTMWDHARTYHFMATRTHGSPDNSPSVMLVWHAIQAAARAGRIYDFDGVFNSGQVQFFTGFGGQTSPRYIVTRKSRRARLVDGAMTAFRQTTGRSKPAEHIF